MTALRWACQLRRLGHRVAVRTDWNSEPCRLLIAVHADKSAAAAARFAASSPRRPLLAVVGGTDFFPAQQLSPAGLRTLTAADRIVVLQPAIVPLLPPALQPKARVIVQAAAALPTPPRPADDGLLALAVGHLRAIKDPLLVARAAQLLPAASRFRVELIGAPLEAHLAAAVAAAAAGSGRFVWLPGLRRRQLLQRLAGADVSINSSAGEGGAAALSEAIAAGTPVLATAIPGNLGLLGEDWPGQYPVGDAAALAALLQRFEGDAGFRDMLRQRTRALQPLVDPVRERQAWRSLLAEVGVS